MSSFVAGDYLRERHRETIDSLFLVKEVGPTGHVVVEIHVYTTHKTITLNLKNTIREEWFMLATAHEVMTFITRRDAFVSNRYGLIRDSRV